MSSGPGAPAFPTRAYTPSHLKWPYTKADMTPRDASDDSAFYSSPRFVTHIDDHAIDVLRDYYGSVLPTPKTVSTNDARRRHRVLDLCSSWISHYPSSLESAAKAGLDIGMDIAGTGMSAAELGANPLFGGKASGKRWVVKDLNVDPSVPPLSSMFAGGEEALLDTTTLTVSIDYLTQPVALLASLLRCTRSGGTVHLAISNRCFPTKAVSRWLQLDEEERLQMVGDYLHFAGWSQVEIVTLSDGTLHDDDGDAAPRSEQRNQLGRLMAMMGMSSGRCDPLWVVRARKASD